MRDLKGGQREEMCTKSSSCLEPPVQAEVCLQESTAPARGWQGSVAASSSEA